MRRIDAADEFEDLIHQLINESLKFEEYKGFSLNCLDQKTDCLINLIKLSAKAISMINTARPALLQTDNNFSKEYVQLMLELLSGLYSNFEKFIQNLMQNKGASQKQIIKTNDVLEAYSLASADRVAVKGILGDFFFCAIKDSNISYKIDGFDSVPEKTVQAFKLSSLSGLNQLKDIIKIEGSLTCNLVESSSTQNFVVVKINEENNSYEIYGLYLSEDTMAHYFFAKLNLIFNPYKGCFEMRLDDLIPEAERTRNGVEFNINSNFFKMVEVLFTSVYLIYFYDHDKIFRNNFLEIQSRTEQVKSSNDLILLHSAINPS